MSISIPVSKYSLKSIEVLSYLLASFLGTLFHFLYEWSGDNFFVGLFFPINESTWEHLKLVFLPILLVSLFEYFFIGAHEKDYICIKFRSSLLGMLTIIVLFYTYTGVLGIVIDWLNILIYFISMGIAYLYSYRKLSSEKTLNCNPGFSFLLMTTLLILFMIFTVFPPSLGIFNAP